MPASASGARITWPQERGFAVRRGDRVRIAYFTDNLRIGGTELSLLRLAERLNTATFDLTVLHLQAAGPLLSRYRDLHIRTIHWPISKPLWLGIARNSLRLRAWLRRERIAILHSHDVYTNALGVIPGRLAGVPAVIASRRWLEIDASRRIQALNRVACRWATRVVVNATSLAPDVMAESGVEASRIACFPNFVEPAAFESPAVEALLDFRHRHRIPPNALVIGSLANLRPVKNHRLLLEAFQAIAPRYPNVHLVLVGDGPLREPLQREVDERGLTARVHLTGQLPNRPNPSFLFDVAALTSDSEGFPNAVLEAMAAGRPVIATSVGGVRDLVVNNETGLLVPARDVTGLVDALETLIRMPDLRSGLGLAGRRRAESMFMDTEVVARIQAWYLSLLAARGGVSPGNG